MCPGQRWAVLRMREIYPQVIIPGTYTPYPAVSPNNRFWYIATVPNFLEVKELAKEPETLYQFFHEEIKRTGGSSILLFIVPQRTGTNRPLILKIFQNRNRWFFKNSKNRPALVLGRNGYIFHGQVRMLQNPRFLIKPYC